MSKVSSAIDDLQTIMRLVIEDRNKLLKENKQLNKDYQKQGKHLLRINDEALKTRGTIQKIDELTDNIPYTTHPQLRITRIGLKKILAEGK